MRKNSSFQNPFLRYVILDRDGTIIENHPYLSDPEKITFLPGALEGLKRLQKAGFNMIIISNQSGIGRGLITEEQLDQIHSRLTNLLMDEGVTIRGIYYCPHHPDDNCLCRKPGLKLMQTAACDFQFDPHESYMVGDSSVDIEFGKKAGAYTILVRTGNGRETELTCVTKPDSIVDTLADAAIVIERLSNEGA